MENQFIAPIGYKAVEPCPMEKAMHYEDPDNKGCYLRVESDLHSLMNENRSKMFLDEDSYQSVLNQFFASAHSDSPLTKLRSKLSDDDILSVMKSRRVQSPSELQKWDNYLQSEQKKKEDESKQKEDSASKLESYKGIFKSMFGFEL